MTSKESMPRYQKTDINWAYFSYCTMHAGYSLQELAIAIGVSPSTIYLAKRERRINPAILDAASKVIPLDIDRALRPPEYRRIQNGKSSTGRHRIDWELLKEISVEQGYSLNSLSIELGKGSSYLHGCKRMGGISIEMLEQLAQVLQYESEELLSIVLLDEPNAVGITKMIDEMLF